MRCPAAHQCETIPELVQFRAVRHPERVAAVFVDDAGRSDSLTFAELWQRSVAVALQLREIREVPQNAFRPENQAALAPRAMLIYPPGLEFLSAFIGSQLAGWIPVPTSYPRPNRAMPRVDSVAEDCSPSAILSTSETIDTIDRRKLTPAAASLPMVAVDLTPDTGRNLPAEHDPIATTVESWLERLSGNSTALLQYTSGSTSEPKGVIVSQQNVMANLRAIRETFKIEPNDAPGPDCQTAVSWLPFFHDMGLIGGVLTPFYCGWRTIYLSPQSFVQRPIRWLQAISDYKAVISGGPNFAYELCGDRIAPEQIESLDLSSWQVAFCGAEPIRGRTLHHFTQRFSAVGFRDSAFLPCYGLAEATLLAAGSDGPASPRLIEVTRESLRDAVVKPVTAPVGKATKRPVSSSSTVTLVSSGVPAPGTTLKIVDPDSSHELPERSVGEIWLAGESITEGYWNRPAENERRFGVIKAKAESPSTTNWFQRAARAISPLNSSLSRTAPSTPPTSDASDHPAGPSTYLRTGDLGFIDQGQLFVTGRIKDIVIIRGRNYAPQDIELSVSSLGTPFQGRTVAISVEGPRTESLAIIAEIARDTDPALHLSLVRDIRRAVIHDHEVDPRVVVLTRPATIPITTSGKVQRSACRHMLIENTLPIRFRWERSGGTESPPLPIPEIPTTAKASDRDEIEVKIRQWLSAWLITRVGIDPSQISDDKNFDQYGLDSLTAVELSGELEDWSGVQLTPNNAWENPTIHLMAKIVTDGLISTSTTPAEQTVAQEQTAS